MPTLKSTDIDDDDLVAGTAEAAVTHIFRITAAGRRQKDDDDDGDDDFVANIANVTVKSIFYPNATNKGVDDDDDSCNLHNSGSLFYVLAALQAVVCLYSIVGNTVLFYKERKTLLWYNKRPLYLGIFFANALASLVHLVTAVLRALQWSVTSISSSLAQHNTRMTFVADAAIMATIFSVATLAFASLYDIRRLHTGTIDYQAKNKTWSILLLCLAWILACAFAVFGFGAHNESAVVRLPDLVTTIGHVGIVTSLQLLVGLALYKIHRHSDKLQTDFAVSRAQQGLEFRTMLMRVDKRTKLVVPLLAADVVLWVILIIVDAIVDNLAGEDGRDNDVSACERGNQTWEKLLDVLSILFLALYPILICRKRASIREQLKIICLCRLETKLDVGPTQTKILAAITRVVQFERPNQREAKNTGVHWTAMQQQWNRVERTVPTVPVRTVPKQNVTNKRILRADQVYAGD